SGQAGATQLLNNPWANSTGAFGLDAAHIKGATSMKVNMAGLARGSSSEIAIGYNEHLIGTQTRIVNAAYSQQLGGGTAFGINVMSTNVGEIEVTTVDQPEGAGATFKPNIFNASAGFAKTFSDRIHVGVGVTFISEGVNDAKSSAASL